MNYRYFAIIMHPNPTPVLNEDGTLARWSDLIAARNETSQMPIANVRDIKIFDLENPV